MGAERIFFLVCLSYTFNALLKNKLRSGGRGVIGQNGGKEDFVHDWWGPALSRERKGTYACF